MYATLVARARGEADDFAPVVQETSASSGVPDASVLATSNDDYVWDVFYRRPFSLSEWNAFAANVGTVSVDLAIFFR